MPTQAFNETKLSETTFPLCAQEPLPIEHLADTATDMAGAGLL